MPDKADRGVGWLATDAEVPTFASVEEATGALDALDVAAMIIRYAERHEDDVAIAVNRRFKKEPYAIPAGCHPIDYIDRVLTPDIEVDHAKQRITRDGHFRQVMVHRNGFNMLVHGLRFRLTGDDRVYAFLIIEKHGAPSSADWALLHDGAKG